MDESKYSIEPHGDVYALYLGRTNEFHGSRICNLSDFSPSLAKKDIKTIESALNYCHSDNLEVKILHAIEAYINAGCPNNSGCTVAEFVKDWAKENL